jgi:hypothetical protein
MSNDIWGFPHVHILLDMAQAGTNYLTVTDWDTHLWASLFPRVSDRTLVIYHYTTVAGLLGILESGHLRGTHVGFLNDTSEIAYGLRVCRTVLEDERSRRGSSQERVVLDNAIGFIESESLPADMYVTSFSKAPDLLGQWRAYGSNGKYCLGFSVARFSERDMLRLPREVEYDLEKQRERVRRGIDAACSHFPDDVVENTAARRGVKLAAYLWKIACLFKHASFREEQEWRAVETVLSFDHPELLHFEMFEGSPRPYIEMLSGSRESHRLPLVDVRVGPSKRRIQTQMAVRALLTKLGYHNVEVADTEIPLAP